MPNLSKTQRDILTTAFQSADGHAETPDGEARAVSGLIKRGLMIAFPREDGPSRLLITQAGRDACGAASSTGAAEPAGAEATAPVETIAADKPAQIPKGKIGALLALLRHPEGTTVEAMMTATGWQAHSVRGALSGAIKKKLGLDVTSEKIDTGRVYRVAPQVDGAPGAAK